MLEATLTMLRARHDERVAAAGVIAGLFCDDLPEAVKRLQLVRDAARECERRTPRRDRHRREIYRLVAAWADDMIGPVKQVADADTQGR